MFKYDVPFSRHDWQIVQQHVGSAAAKLQSPIRGTVFAVGYSGTAFLLDPMILDADVSRNTFICFCFVCIFLFISLFVWL